MLSGRRGDARELGQSYGLFAGAFVGLLVVFAMLGQYGLPDPFIAVLVVALTLLSFGVIGVLGRTLSETHFYLAGRAVPHVFNGLATTTAFVSGTGFIGLAGAFFAVGSGALALIIGIGAGFLLLAVLVAPYLRKSGAVTLPDFLAIRYDRGDLPRAIGLLALILVSFPALAGAIAATVFIFETFLKVGAHLAFDIAVGTILLSTLLGGMRAVTLVAGAQAIILLVGLLAPAAIVSVRDYGLPIPQLTYGYALDEVTAAGGTLATMASRFLPLSDMSWSTLAAVAISLSTGIASLPHLIERSLSADRIAGARRSLGWALFFVAIVLLTAPALAAFVKAAVFNQAVGSAVEDLPDWVYTYGKFGLVKICGIDAVDLAAIKSACASVIGDTGLGAGNIAVSPDIVALALPDVTGFPFVITALLAAGGLAAALGGANALAITIATAAGYDFYGRLVAPLAPAGRRLIVTRAMLLATVLAAAALAAHSPGDALALAAASPALAAAAFFPALVLGIWWRRTTSIAAVAGIAAGFLVTAVHIAATWHGAGAGVLLGFADPHVPPIAAGIFGVPVGFLVIVGLSLVTPAPSRRQLDVLDAIRRPSRDPVLEAGGA
jgi:cation/acetate symporter